MAFILIKLLQVWFLRYL